MIGSVYNISTQRRQKLSFSSVQIRLKSVVSSHDNNDNYMSDAEMDAPKELGICKSWCSTSAKMQFMSTTNDMLRQCRMQRTTISKCDAFLT